MSSIDTLRFYEAEEDLRRDTWVTMEKHLLPDRRWIKCATRPNRTHTYRTRAAQGLVGETDGPLSSLNFASLHFQLLLICDLLLRFSFPRRCLSLLFGHDLVLLDWRNLVTQYPDQH